ncbi:MAG: hypothetical protein HDR32_05235 [Treponema sp.]|nr:hypothetical protein [Treponema sp.]
MVTLFSVSLPLNASLPISFTGSPSISAGITTLFALPLYFRMRTPLASFVSSLLNSFTGVGFAKVLAFAPMTLLNSFTGVGFAVPADFCAVPLASAPSFFWHAVIPAASTTAASIAATFIIFFMFYSLI